MSLHLTGYVDMVDVNTVLERLHATLSTTNAIENVMGAVAYSRAA